MKQVIAGIVIFFLIIGGISYGYFQWKRTWNYSWGYESRVKETVCEMVKPEYLRNPEDC